MADREAAELESSIPKRFSSFIVDVPVQQDGEGDPSPDNVRYITQWSKVDAFVADSISEDTPVATVQLPSPIYGGQIDVVRGEVASTYNVKMNSTGWEMVEEGQFRCSVSAYNNGDETSTNVADLYSSHYKTVSNKDAYDGTDDLTCGLATIEGTTYLYVNDADYTTLEAFTEYVGVVMFVFKAHIPMSDTVDPQIIFLPEGTSYVWATGVEVVADVVIELVGNAAPIVRYFPHDSVATECDVSFTPSQDLHGYDSPWPAGGGKNLYNMDDDQYGKGMYWNASNGTLYESTAYYASPKIPVQPDTQYVRNAGANANIFYDVNGDYLNFESTGQSITTPSNAYYVAFNIAVDVDHATVQLEKGTTSTAWSPFANICPISGWDGVSVYAEPTYDPTADPKASVTFGVQGKNLFNKNDAGIETKKAISNTSGNTYTANSWSVSGYIPVKPNEYYILSSDGSDDLDIVFFDENKTYITGYSDGRSAKQAPANARYVRFDYKTANVDNTMLEQGQSASAYEPYRDYILGGTANITDGTGDADTAEVDLGTLNWAYSSSNKRFYATLVNAKNVSATDVANALCEQYSPYAWNTVAPDDTINNAFALTQTYITIRDLRYDDTTQFTAAVSGVKLVYEVATPTTYTFPPASEELTIQKNKNYLWATMT